MLSLHAKIYFTFFRWNSPLCVFIEIILRCVVVIEIFVNNHNKTKALVTNMISSIKFRFNINWTMEQSLVLLSTLFYFKICCSISVTNVINYQKDIFTATATQSNGNAANNVSCEFRGMCVTRVIFKIKWKNLFILKTMEVIYHGLCSTCLWI